MGLSGFIRLIELAGLMGLIGLTGLIELARLVGLIGLKRLRRIKRLIGLLGLIGLIGPIGLAPFHLHGEHGFVTNHVAQLGEPAEHEIKKNKVKKARHLGGDLGGDICCRGWPLLKLI